jgi:tetratricopeptide (TPR) repeat protein/MinD-like ATPase involved in chromosome partitioning or flagellar assembly
MRTITFYSYKGGTGRTLLLANMARMLAGLGMRAVAIDFDLEAPGLVYKLAPQQSRSNPGLVGWLRDALAGEAPAALSDYLIEIPIAEPLLTGGSLKLMPAGRAPSPNYFQDLLRLRLDQRLDDGSGTDALIELQRRIAEELKADFLLVDARTGITPTNTVTTHILADDVVVLALDTDEQLEGTRSVLRSLQPLASVRTSEPIGLNVMLSRVPDRPASVIGTSPEEKRQIARVLAFLNEPAEPLAKTLTISSLHLLHSDTELTRQEFVSYEGPSERSRSLLHADYGRAAETIFGHVFTAAREEALRRAAPDRLELVRQHLVVVHVDSLSPSNRPGNDGPLAEREIEAIQPQRPPSEEKRVQEIPSVAEATPEDAAAAIEEAKQLLDEGSSVYSTGPRRAERLLLLAESLRPISRYEEALAATTEAAGIYRRLAETGVYENELGHTLLDLGVLLTRLNRDAEATDVDREAVDVFRRQVDRGAASEVELARALDNLGVDLSRIGRHAEAIETFQEAIERWRRIAEGPPPDHLDLLIVDLDRLSQELQMTNRSEDAAAIATEGWEWIQRLDRESGRTTPSHVVFRLLTTQSASLLALGRRAEALAAAQKAVAIKDEVLNAAIEDERRAILFHNLSVTLKSLNANEDAATFASLAATLRISGTEGEDTRAAFERQLRRAIDLILAERLPEAKETALAAVELARELVTDDERERLSLLARGLGVLTKISIDLGDADDLLLQQEEIAVRRRLVADAGGPEDWSGLAISLNNYGVRALVAKDGPAALAYLAEARSIWESLTEEDEAQQPLGLSTTLGAIAFALRELGRPKEALAPGLEMVAHWRRLAGDNPAWRPHLADALYELSRSYDRLEQSEAMAAAAAEAATIYDELARHDQSATLLSQQSDSYEALWTALRRCGDVPRMLEAGRQAAYLCRRLVSMNEDADGDKTLSRILHNLSVDLVNTGHTAEGIATATESSVLRRAIVARDPSRQELANFASTLANLTRAFDGESRDLDAARAVTEAIAVYDQLAAAYPDEYDEPLATGLTELAVHLGRNDDMTGAAAASQRGVEILRKLAVKEPEANRGRLAGALNNLALFLSSIDQPGPALEAIDEANEIYESLAASDQDGEIARELAMSLTTRAQVLEIAERREEAVDVRSRAIELVRRLADQAPKEHNLWLASLLAHHGERLSQLGRTEEARVFADESAELANSILGAHGES